MDELITQIVKFLSNTVIVHIYSYPHFSIETFLASVVCVVHCLLIFEVNSLYRRTNAKAAIKLRMRHPIKDDESTYSYQTLSCLQSPMCPQKIERTTTKESFYVPYRRLNRKISTNSNFGWVITHGDTVLRHGFNDRAEQLLAISPSEYVRKDKERKNREAGLKSCIQSLTSLLEKALTHEKQDMADRSIEAIKQSIKSIKDNFDHMSRDNYLLTDIQTPSFQSLITHSITKQAIGRSLSPQVMNMNVSIHNFESNFDEDDNREHSRNYKECMVAELCRKKSADIFSDLFGDESVDSIQRDHISGFERLSLTNIPNF